MTRIAELTDRAVLRIGGAEARDFLQGLLTNDLGPLGPARAVYAGLLSAQGKALFDLILHDGGDGAVLADVDAARAEALAKRLTMYKLRRPVTIEPSPLRVFAAWGGDAGRPGDPRTAALGQRWLAEAGESNASAEDYDRHRLELGVPGSPDIGSDSLLWLETDAEALSGVSFAKGCYVGQENTARMHHRDKLRKRLGPVAFAGDPGDGHIMAGDRLAGELRSHRDGLGIALLRDELAGAGELTMNGGPVTVRRPAWRGPD